MADAAEWGLLAPSVATGAIFILHGWPDITGDRRTAEMVTGSPRRAATALFASQGVVEVARGALLALGVVTQIAAIPLAIIIGATYLEITGFDTFYARNTTGWESNVLILAGLLLATVEYKLTSQLQEFVPQPKSSKVMVQGPRL